MKGALLKLKVAEKQRYAYIRNSTRKKLQRVEVASFALNKLPRVWRGMVYLPVWLIESSLGNRPNRKSDKFEVIREQFKGRGQVLLHYVSILSLSLNRACHDSLVDLLLLNEEFRSR